MKFACVVFLLVLTGTLATRCPHKKTTSKLVCYYSDVKDINGCMCTHIILPANSDVRTIEDVQEKFKDSSVLLTVTEFNEDLVNVLKTSKLDGLEINLKKLDDKNDVLDFISTVKSKLDSDLLFAVSIPSRAEVLAKFYDLKALTKHADLFILQTAFLGASQNVTFHPSRLSGLWDMQNTDSVVDLVSGMGAPLSKVVITAPVQAFQFTLQNEAHTAPGSPALEIKSVTREQLCSKMSRGSNWTLERDQDQAGPYIFRKNMWIAFDDAVSMDIKAKYARVRGLAGLALKDLSQDGGEKCGGFLLTAAYNGLSKQSRAPRGAVLQSLEREILETPSRPLDTIQISPYRISRVIDVEGNVHSVRQDTRTEFECARQGYFVHPRSCGRFYRCVKFDQLGDDFSVFEFDCPAGLSFDSRYEVCVWPGSLPYSSACSGSSEIAPVPRTRFVCPQGEGYYADPENCRWFFACLDHGKSPLSAYEFRCPFGLVFDQSRLVCEWPWLVPKCGSGDAAGFEFGSGAIHGGARLETYDGLGALGVVGLGGLSGSFVQPQAKVYTSVSNGLVHSQDGSGFNQHGQNLNVFAGAGLSSGHGSSNFNGAGVDQGLGLTSGAHLIGGSINSAAGLGVVGQGVVGTAQGGSFQSSIDFGSKLHANRVDSSNLFGSGALGIKTANVVNHGVIFQQPLVGGLAEAHQNFQHQAGITQSFGAGHVGVTPVEKIHIVGGYSAVGTGGQSAVELSQNGININGIARVTPVPPLSTVSIVSPSPTPIIAAAPVPVVASDSETYEGGVVANVPELQYKIVAPSSSNALFQSNVDYSLSRGSSGLANRSIDYVNYVSSTPASLGLSSINYEFSTPLASSIQSSTIRPLVSAGYHYPKPAVAFEEEPIRIAKPTAVSSFSFNQHSSGDSGFEKISFVGPKPTVGVVQPAVVSTYSFQPTQPSIVSSFSINNAHTPVQIHQPVVSVTPSSVPVIQPVVSSYSFQNVAQNRGYQYSNSAGAQRVVGVTPSSVPFIQQHVQPVVSSYSFQNAAKNRDYQYTKSAVVQPIASVTPTVPVIQQVVHPVQPAVVSSFSFQNAAKTSGYQFSNSAAVQPVVAVTPSSVPFVEHIHHVQPAVVSSYSFQNAAKNKDYQNTKSAVVQPIVSITPTVPVIPQEIHPVQPDVVSSYNFQNSLSSQDGYHYPKPSVAFEERPAAVSSFSINSVHKPLEVVQPVQLQHVPVVHHQPQPAIVSSYSFENSAKNEGYQYSRPSVAFKTFHPVVSSTPVIPIIAQPAVVSSFSFQNLTSNGGFDFSRQVPVQPIISVTPSTTIVHETLRQQSPVVSGYNFQNYHDHQYKQVVPVVQNKIKPAVVSSYSFQNEDFGQRLSVQPVFGVTSTAPTIIQPVQPAFVSSYNYQNTAHNEGYKYTKQTVPVPNLKPVVTHNVHSVQPAAVSSYNFQSIIGNTGASYGKQTLQPIQPVVAVTPGPAIVSSYSLQNLANRDAYKYNQPVQPLVPVSRLTETVHSVQPSLGAGYSFETVVGNEGYKYTNQAVPVQRLQPVAAVTPTVPFVQQNIHQVQPAIVSSYNIHNVAKQPVKPTVVSSYSFNSVSNDEAYGFNQQQPLQPIVSVTPVVPVQPAVVSSFSFQNLVENQKSKQVVFAKQPAVTPATVIKQTLQPAVVSSYSFNNFAQSDRTNQVGYDYPKPVIAFEEKPVVSVNQPPSFSIHDSLDQGYSYPKPSVRFEESLLKVAVVQPTTIRPILTVTPTVNSVISNGRFGEKISISSYQKPVVIENTYVSQPQRPIKVQQPVILEDYQYRRPVQEVPFVAKKAYVTGGAEIGYSYPKPAVAFEERPSFVHTYSTPIVTSTVRYEPVSVPVNPFQEYVQPVQKVTAFRGKSSFTTPVIVEDYYQSTPVPNIYISSPAPFTRSKTRARVNVNAYSNDVYASTPKPTYSSTVAAVLGANKESQGQFHYFDSRLQSTPVVPLVTSTLRPLVNKYSFGSFDDQYQINVATSTPRPLLVSTTTQNYVDDSIVVTTPSRAYLPAKTITASSKPKTYIRVNDFHPLLPAKLGAQCTCTSTSNTLTLRRKPVLPAASASGDDDGYYVKPSSNPVALENYSYEPKRVVVTPAPTYIVQSTTNTIVPAPAPVVVSRKRVRVRPVTTPATVFFSEPSKAPEVFLKNQVAPVVGLYREEEPRSSNEQSVKVSAKVGSNDFDRYGPGGWRSRQETLQGTVDCQRAGLFRHPEQCNKFYTCRWDCTKNRFTLHVFNCPVHLTFDNNLGACNWPSQGPACAGNTLLPNE